MQTILDYFVEQIKSTLVESIAKQPLTVCLSVT